MSHLSQGEVPPWVEYMKITRKVKRTQSRTSTGLYFAGCPLDLLLVCLAAKSLVHGVLCRRPGCMAIHWSLSLACLCGHSPGLSFDEPSPLTSHCELKEAVRVRWQETLKGEIGREKKRGRMDEQTYSRVGQVIGGIKGERLRVEPLKKSRLCTCICIL